MAGSSADERPSRRQHRRRYSPSDDSEEDRYRQRRDDSPDTEQPREKRTRDRSSRTEARTSDHTHRHRRSRSNSRERHSRSHRKSRSRSPAPKRRRRSRSRSRSPATSSRRPRGPLPSQNEQFQQTIDPNATPIPEKQKPNFKPTGLLAKEANTVAGTSTVLKYHEPAEARKPPTKEPWRVYVFKKKELLDTLYIHRRSAWLVGRDRKVTDLFLEHPSISKQHAVLQFRHSTTTNEFGDRTNRVKPYVIDLESANGTLLNGEKVAPSRFVELVDGDVLGFGESEREYVLMLPPPD